MLRTKTCGELTLKHAGQTVTLCGWLARSRDLGGMTFIDLRDRYGITQLAFNMDTNKELCEQARKLGREFVLCATGKIVERSSKNLKMPTGEIEIIVDKLEILNESKTPPFTIEDDTDGGDELRMKYRYLDLRRNSVKNNLLQRHKVAQAVREYFDANGFVDVETPFLIKSTPEGARDFVVPSRLNQGEFYALPQSPQTFKQLLMVSGFDRYYQIVRCFRDEDLRADRQPEFTQIDCEMSFVEQEDVMNMFEGMVKHVFKKVRGLDLPAFSRMSYEYAMQHYGNDKPDTRFGMEICELKSNYDNYPFPELYLEKMFAGTSTYVGAICIQGCANYSRKQLDELSEFVKKPRGESGGATYINRGPLFIKYGSDLTIKAPILDKNFSEDEIKKIVETVKAQPGDLVIIISNGIGDYSGRGTKGRIQKLLSDLRLELGSRLGLRKKEDYKPLWVTDFPLLEWNEEDRRWYAMHHPFTSPHKEDIHLFNSLANGEVAVGVSPRANAYDIVINGVEVGGGSIRIHNKELQQQMFKVLGLTKEETEQKFSFILNAFEYGAPPHGGIAFGLDRLSSMVINNEDYIRDYIAFPKNNSGRDVMLDSPSLIDEKQKKELGLK